MDNKLNVLKEYNLKEVSPVKLLRESGDNRVYIVGKNDKKVLRIGKKIEANDLRFEYEFLNHLKTNRLPVASWIVTKNGEFCTQTCEGSIAVLFDFIEGVHVAEGHLPSGEQAFNAGKMLAGISEASISFSSDAPRQRSIYSELGRVQDYKEVFLREFEGGDIFVNEVEEALDFAERNQGMYSVIHNDYRMGNVFFDVTDKVNGVIDFDWCCFGPSIKDLALGVLEWSYLDGQDGPDFSLFDAFLKGYNEVSAIKVEKDKELFAWIKFSALSDTATFFCDRLGFPNLKKRVSSSYMYKKYLFFKDYAGQ